MDRWVEDGPELARDGVVRWRCRDLRERIARKFGVSLHEPTVGKLLAKLRFRRLSVRPHHPESDPAAASGFSGGLRRPGEGGCGQSGAESMQNRGERGDQAAFGSAWSSFAGRKPG